MSALENDEPQFELVDDDEEIPEEKPRVGREDQTREDNDEED